MKAGSIVPMGPRVQFVDEKPDAPIELRVYPGADGAFTLYEDEGDDYRYEKGACTTIPITWNDKTKTLTIGVRKGEFPGMLKTRTFRVVWVSENHGAGAGIMEEVDAIIQYDGKATTVRAKVIP